MTDKFAYITPALPALFLCCILVAIKTMGIVSWSWWVALAPMIAIVNLYFFSFILATIINKFFMRG